MLLKSFIPALVLAVLTGCASYKPVPDGYTGQVATVGDSGFAEDFSKAQLFVLAEIDGNRIDDSMTETRLASQGQGARLTMGVLSRQIPARPMKVRLIASHTTAAPIMAIASQMAGTFYSVDGVVDFSPKPDGKYVVKGDLKKEGSSVWIEDAASGQPVTGKVVKK